MRIGVAAPTCTRLYVRGSQAKHNLRDTQQNLSQILPQNGLAVVFRNGLVLLN